MNKHHLIKIKNWVFDPQAKTIIQDDAKKICINLEKKQCLFLMCLINNHGKVVSRDELIASVWQGRIVEDLTVTAVVSRIRKLLAGDKDEYIKTHPKVGYSLVCPIQFIEREIIPTETSAAGKTPSLTLKTNLNTKIMAAILCLGFVIIFILLEQTLNQKMPESNALTKQSGLVPLTYLEGMEISATISPDQSLLAFVHKKDAISDMQLIVKNTQTNQNTMIEPEHFTTSPRWSSDGIYLYYQIFTDDACLIKRVKPNKNLNYSNSEIVASCGNVPSINPLAISSHWLYFSFKEVNSEPFILKRKHLFTGLEEILTAPSIKFHGDISVEHSPYGDYSLSLSHDGSKLAFIRGSSYTNNELMYLDLNSGLVTSLAQFSHLMYSIDYIDWNIADDRIIFIDKNYSVASIDIESKEIEYLYQSQERILSPKVISADELLVSIASSGFFNSNIKQIKLDQESPSAEFIVQSSFKDYGATVYPDAKQELIVFVSDRSGYFQIWLNKETELSQLTHFSESNSISNLSFSDDGKVLIFIKNQQLFSLDIKTLTTTLLSQPEKPIKSPIWLCDRRGIILASILDQGVWDLYQIDLISNTRNRLLADVDSIKKDCTNNQYFVTVPLNAGIHKLDEQWRIAPQNAYLSNTHLTNDFKWAVNDNYLYYLNEGQIYKYNLLNQQQVKVLTNQTTVKGFSIANNRLIFSHIVLKNTYIAKIPIKAGL